LFYLNFRYLVNIFQKNGHPLHGKLEKLNDLSSQKCLIPFHEVSGLDLQPEVGFMRHELESCDMYPIVAPLELRAGIALFSPSNLFYSDGSLMDGVTGFTVHHSIDCNIGFQMRGPASVFTVKLKALGRYLILTDRMSSIRAMESRKISLHIWVYPSVRVRV
jgi:hypothetical protein